MNIYVILLKNKINTIFFVCFFRSHCVLKKKIIYSQNEIREIKENFFKKKSIIRINKCDVERVKIAKVKTEKKTL